MDHGCQGSDVVLKIVDYLFNDLHWKDGELGIEYSMEDIPVSRQSEVLAS